MLQTDGAVAQRQQRLAGDFEVAMRHRHCGFFMHAGQILRHGVAAIVDQRLMDGTKTRRAVRRQILDAERLNHIHHEIRAGYAFDACRFPRRVAWRAGFGSGPFCRRRQGGGRTRCWRRGIGGTRGRYGICSGGCAGRQHAGQKLPAACLFVGYIFCFAFHCFLAIVESSSTGPMMHRGEVQCNAGPATVKWRLSTAARSGIIPP